MLSNGSLRIVVLQVHVVRIYIFSLKQMIKNMKSWKYNCKFKYCEKQASIFTRTFNYWKFYREKKQALQYCPLLSSTLLL